LRTWTKSIDPLVSGLLKTWWPLTWLRSDYLLLREVVVVVVVVVAAAAPGTELLHFLMVLWM